MFRKYTNPLLLVCWMVLSACAPALTPIPATATPTLTLEPTRTPTPAPTTTITPTPTPSLPPELLASLPDDLPASWEAVQAGDTWYIMDNSNNANILRYPVGAETWQARRDVTITNETTGVITTYEGWLTAEGSTEVTPTIKAGMEYIRIKNQPTGYSSLVTGFGCLTKYQVVEITDGQEKQEKMDIDFFTMQYLLNNNRILTIDYQADNKLVGRRGFDITQNLGELFNVLVLVPTNGESFSDEFMSSVTKIQSYNQLQQIINFSGNWIMPNELLNLLNNPPGDYLDLRFRVNVDQFSQPPQ